MQMLREEDNNRKEGKTCRAKRQRGKIIDVHPQSLVSGQDFVDARQIGVSLLLATESHGGVAR